MYDINFITEELDKVYKYLLLANCGYNKNVYKLQNYFEEIIKIHIAGL